MTITIHPEHEGRRNTTVAWPSVRAALDRRIVRVRPQATISAPARGRGQPRPYTTAVLATTKLPFPRGEGVGLLAAERG